MQSGISREWIFVLISTMLLLNSTDAQSTSKDDLILSPRLLELGRQLTHGNSDRLVEFEKALEEEGAPLVEPLEGNEEEMLVTFVWRGNSETENVVVFLQSGGPDPADNRMERLASTDLWYKSYIFGRDARFVYSLSPNDSLVPLDDPNVDFRKRFSTVQRDPLNPKHHPLETEGVPPFMVLSMVEMPEAPPQPWAAKRSGIAHGDVKEEFFVSKILGNERQLFVYRPPEYSPDRNEPYPLLVMFDGWSYIHRVPTPTILDNLISDGRIPPTVAVLIDTRRQRGRELSCYRPFASFLCEELLPSIRDRYHVTHDPGRTIISGSSLGGLAATCTAMWNPDAFGKVLSQSGSYYWKPAEEEDFEWVGRQFASMDRLPLEFYLDVGLLEKTMPKPGGLNQLTVNRNFHRILRDKGYQVHYQEFNGAHEHVCWQGTLGDGLIALLND